MLTSVSEQHETKRCIEVLLAWAFKTPEKRAIITCIDSVGEIMSPSAIPALEYNCTFMGIRHAKTTAYARA
jgi:hypothetical protein